MKKILLIFCVLFATLDVFGQKLTIKKVDIGRNVTDTVAYWDIWSITNAPTTRFKIQAEVYNDMDKEFVFLLQKWDKFTMLYKIDGVDYTAECREQVNSLSGDYDYHYDVGIGQKVMISLFVELPAFQLPDLDFIDDIMSSIVLKWVHYQGLTKKWEVYSSVPDWQHVVFQNYTLDDAPRKADYLNGVPPEEWRVWGDFFD